MNDYTKKLEQSRKYPSRKIPEEIAYWLELTNRLEKERDAFFENGIRIVRERDILQKKLDIAIKALGECKWQPLNSSIIIDQAYIEMEKIK